MDILVPGTTSMWKSGWIQAGSQIMGNRQHMRIKYMRIHQIMSILVDHPNMTTPMMVRMTLASPTLVVSLDPAVQAVFTNRSPKELAFGRLRTFQSYLKGHLQITRKLPEVSFCKAPVIYTYIVLSAAICLQ